MWRATGEVTSFLLPSKSFGPEAGSDSKKIFYSTDHSDSGHPRAYGCGASTVRTVPLSVASPSAGSTTDATVPGETPWRRTRLSSRPASPPPTAPGVQRTAPDLSLARTGHVPLLDRVLNKRGRFPQRAYTKYQRRNEELTDVLKGNENSKRLLLNPQDTDDKRNRRIPSGDGGEPKTQMGLFTGQWRPHSH